MTNADTPLLALDGIIDEPVNPFTGNKLSSAIKEAPEHRIAYCENDATELYRGGRNDYIVKEWVTMKGNDTFDLSAWRIVDD